MCRIYKLSVLFSFILATSPYGFAGKPENFERQTTKNFFATAENKDMEILQSWQAGATVSEEAVKAFGMARCFTAEAIPDVVFQRMQGKTYKKGCTIPRRSLRYVKVLHINGSGQTQLGELVCNEAIAKDLVEIFKALYDAAYPIERMVLIDNYDAQDEPSMLANNTSCFNFRFIARTKKLSNHSRGRAIDINPLYNPYVKRRANGTLFVSPEKGRPYADRTKTFKYKISHKDLCFKLFKKHGFVWGGDWHSLQDFQHFEKP